MSNSSSEASLDQEEKAAHASKESILTDESEIERRIEQERQHQKQQYLATLPPDKKKEMKEIFTLFDMDGSGNIDPDELRVVMKAMGVFLPPHEIENLVRENLGSVDELELDDFMYLMAIVMAKNDYREELIKSFKLFAGNGEHITFKDLKRVAKDLGQAFADEELQVFHLVFLV